MVAFRIGLGLLLLLDIVDRASELGAHYTDAGVVPREALHHVYGGTPLSLHFLSGSFSFQAVLFAVAAVLALMLTVGIKARIAAIGSYVLLLSVMMRNPIIIHNGDQLLRFLLLWAMFLPLERGPPKRSVFSIATVALLLQPLFVYLVAGASKMYFEPWHDGRALYAVLNKAAYVRPLGSYVASELTGVTTWLSYGTLVIELGLPLLLLVPWKMGPLRSGCVLANVVFQGSIFALVNIGYFQPLSILALIPFLPPWFWDRIVKRFQARRAGCAQAPSRRRLSLRRVARIRCDRQRVRPASAGPRERARAAGLGGSHLLSGSTLACVRQHGRHQARLVHRGGPAR